MRLPVPLRHPRWHRVRPPTIPKAEAKKKNDDKDEDMTETDAQNTQAKPKSYWRPTVWVGPRGGVWVLRGWTEWWQDEP